MVGIFKLSPKIFIDMIDYNLLSCDKYFINQKNYYFAESDVDGGGDMTEDDGSDLLSEMEMKARLGKAGNNSENVSNPKQFNVNKQMNGPSTEDLSFSLHNTIKGENNEDILQFPLGVRIKKEVLDPREDVGEEGKDEQETDNINMTPLKGSKRSSAGQRTNVIGKMPPNVSNKSNNEDDVVEALKKAVADVPDVSQVWKIVRPRILSQCQIWDLLMDKVTLTIYQIIFHGLQINLLTLGLIKIRFS